MKEQLKSIDERAKEELSHIDDAKLLEDLRQVLCLTVLFQKKHMRQWQLQ